MHTKIDTGLYYNVIFVSRFTIYYSWLSNSNEVKETIWKSPTIAAYNLYIPSGLNKLSKLYKIKMLWLQESTVYRVRLTCIYIGMLNIQFPKQTNITFRGWKLKFGV